MLRGRGKQRPYAGNLRNLRNLRMDSPSSRLPALPKEHLELLRGAFELRFGRRDGDAKVAFAVWLDERGSTR